MDPAAAPALAVVVVVGLAVVVVVGLAVVVVVGGDFGAFAAVTCSSAFRTLSLTACCCDSTAC